MPDQPTRQFVSWTAEDGLATLTIDRPPLNPLSHRVKAEMLACLEEIAANATLRCLVLYGAGGQQDARLGDLRGA